MRRFPARALLWRAAVVAVVAAVAAVLVARAAQRSVPPPATNTSASAWRLPSLDGSGEVTLSSFRGRPLVLDFFATWCTACRGELPEMAAVSSQLRSRVAFAGVDSLESGDGLAMARQYGIAWWPLARDVGGADASGLHDTLGAAGMPVTAFYAASGRLLDVVEGAMTDTDLRSRITQLFGVSGG